jgi:multisubunit Na+/H+ antiporter MnhC subunit
MLITLQNGNVLSGLALTHSDAEFTSAKDSLVTALVITLICVGIGLRPLLPLHAHRAVACACSRAVVAPPILRLSS